MQREDLIVAIDSVLPKLHAVLVEAVSLLQQVGADSPQSYVQSVSAAGGSFCVALESPIASKDWREHKMTLSFRGGNGRPDPTRVVHRYVEGSHRSAAEIADNVVLKFKMEHRRLRGRDLRRGTPPRR